MPVVEDEAVMLRTYPFGEGGQIVSFLSREHGKLRGHARSSRRMKSPFGSALEPFTRCRVIWFQKETRQLVTLDHADILSSPYLRCAEDLEAAWHLQYLTEIVELVAPDGEPDPLLYRLMAAAGDAAAAGADIRLVTAYFEVWTLRLQGTLPDLGTCGLCDGILEKEGVLDVRRDLLLCPGCAHRSVRRAQGETDRRIPAPILRFLQECLRRSLEELSAAEIPDETVRGASRALRPLLVRYVGREIRSLRFLDTLPPSFRSC